MFVRSVIAACLFAFASLAQVPCRWDAEAAQASPASFSCYRGETLEFIPAWLEYGTTVTNATYTLQWQTNGMGKAYWTTNILRFTPAMDVGAGAYTIFIRAETTNGISYRANAKIKMLGAPGQTVNVLPLPVSVIDFATITTTNAPWLLAETDTASLAAIATETNRAIQAEALLYPRNNPSNYITIAQVPAETDTAALAALATETNRATQAEALLYPRTNPSNYITNNTANLSLSNTTLNGYVSVAGARIDMPRATFVASDNYIKHLGWAGFEFYSGGAMNEMPLGFTLSPANRKLTFRCIEYTPMEEYVARDWYFPQEFASNAVASRAWAEALLYPRNNPSNYITLAQVPAQTNQAYVASAGVVTGAQSNTIASAVQPAAIAAFTTASITNGLASTAITNGLVTAAAAAVPGIVRTMIHTNQLWGATGTNATYCMSWDSTNMTFKVEEILP